jgi:hypothetical protein
MARRRNWQALTLAFFNSHPPETQGELVAYPKTSISPAAFGEDALSRAVVECKDLAGAQNKATPLLEIWARQGARHARVLNQEGETAAEVPATANTRPD